MPSDPRVMLTISARPGVKASIKVRCRICDQPLERYGSGCFPFHYLPDLIVMTPCEGSGFTLEDQDLILSDRAEQDRPGRYVRPHP
jgi:hypothetical protein